MSFSRELIQHSFRLLGSSTATQPSGPDLRRAVSAAYYALFHHLSQATVSQIAPQVPPETASRIHRWLDHTEMKRICGEFAATQLRQPLNALLPGGVSGDLQAIASGFIRLQGARHSADYDLEYRLARAEALDFIIMAENAMDAWDRICPSTESNIFVLSLLLWKKWESSRQ